MALLTIPEVTKGTSTTVTLDKSILFSLSSIATDAYFSVQSNVAYCTVQYLSSPGNQSHSLKFDLSGAAPTASVLFSTTARPRFYIQRLFLEDHDKGILVVDRANLPTGLDINTFPPLTSLSISSANNLLYVEQQDYTGTQIIGYTGSLGNNQFSPSDQLTLTVQRTPVSAENVLTVNPSTLFAAASGSDFVFNRQFITTGNTTVTSDNSITSNSLPITKYLVKQITNFLNTTNAEFNLIGKIGSYLYFIADSVAGTNAYKIYKTDGTTVQQVIDINGVGVRDTDLNAFLISGTDIVFWAFFPSFSGYKIFSLSTLDNSLTQLSDLNPGVSDRFGAIVPNLFKFNNEIYWFARTAASSTVNKLAKTSGTPASSIQVSNTRDNNALSDGLSVTQVKVTPNYLFFVAANASGLLKLYAYSGSGTVSSADNVSNFNPGLSDGVSVVTSVFIGNALYFISSTAPGVNKICKSSGTLASSVVVSNTRGNSAQTDSPSSLTQNGTDLYFSAQNPLGRSKLWRIETASADAITQASDINPSGSDGITFIKPGLGRVYFNGAVTGAIRKLYRTNGTVASQAQVTNTTGSSLVSDGIPVNPFFEFSGHLYFFSALANGTSLKLFRVDASDVVTQVTDAYSGNTDFSGITNYAIINNKIYLWLNRAYGSQSTVAVYSIDSSASNAQILNTTTQITDLITQSTDGAVTVLEDKIVILSNLFNSETLQPSIERAAFCISGLA